MKMKNDNVYPRYVLWKGIMFPSLEICSLKRNDDGWLMEGSLTAKFRETGQTIVYQIFSDCNFNSLSAYIEVVSPWNKKRVDLQLRGGNWFVNGKIREDLAECRDVDLELSPATNTLPIRRSAVRIGEKVELVAAWIRVPDLTVEPLRQSYERISETMYLYKSNNFQAKLEVDEIGLVTSYEGVWQKW